MDVHPRELAQLWYFKGFWPISNWAGTERLSEFRVSAILCWHLTVESCPLWGGILQAVIKITVSDQQPSSTFPLHDVFLQTLGHW